MQLQWDDAVMVTGLKGRQDLNNRAGRVCKMEPRSDGRVGIEMLIGMERVWVKEANLVHVSDASVLENDTFAEMPESDLTDLGLLFFANEGSTRIPGLPARLMSTDPVSSKDEGGCNPDAIKCEICKRHPKDISEYVTAALDSKCSPSTFVMQQEGTFNRSLGLFYCTKCYIEIGCPLGRAGFRGTPCDQLNEADLAFSDAPARDFVRTLEHEDDPEMNKVDREVMRGCV